MTSEQAKIPNPSTNDWKAIDIFVFSNGQQYSPPRKYHLRTDDLNLWNSTLSFLAKSQYGSIHSHVDLYTTDGQKIENPLELSNGAPYVAVARNDTFLDTGYDKYLLRASRSWEKRQSKKLSVAEPDLSNRIPNEIAEIDEHENTNMQLQEEALVTKESSMVEHDTSKKVQPKLSMDGHHNPNIQGIPTKILEQRRQTIQRPTALRKVTMPVVSPVPNMKTAFKKKDSIKPCNVKVLKPENARNSFSNKTNVKNISTNSKNNTTKLKEPELNLNIQPDLVTPITYKTENELKSSSSVRMATENGLLSSNINIKNVTEEKETVLVSNIYQNPNRLMSSVTIEPKYVKNIDTKQTHTMKSIPVQNNTIKNNNYPTTRNSENRAPLQNKHSNKGDKISGSKEKIPKGPNKQNGNTNANYEKKTSGIYHNEITKIIISPPQKLSILSNKITDNNNPLVNNDTEVNPQHKNDNNEIHNISNHEILVIETSNLPDTQYVTHNIVHDADTLLNMNKEISPNELKSYNLTSTPPHLITTDKSSGDQYVAVLNKGDVVNLKVNIEIQNADGLIKLIDHTNLHSVPTKRAEKGSQINVASQMIVQNSSLLSLIAKEINERQKGDDHLFIIVQYSGCKCCNNVTIPDNDTNANYMILLPKEKYEDNVLRCYCDRSQHEICRSSIINPVKATFSCMSVQRLTKINQIECTEKTVLQTTPSPDLKLHDNYSEEHKTIDNTTMVSKKNSITIHSEIVPSSKIFHEIININTELSRVCKEYVEVPNVPRIDKFTQTEWCDVLVEVSLRNGHYTFHLPSLEILKCYKLI